MDKKFLKIKSYPKLLPNFSKDKNKRKIMPITLTKLKDNQVISTDLTKTVQDLSNGLSALKPNNSETTQIITYALIATAVVGIFVYHYIRNQEQIN